MSDKQNILLVKSLQFAIRIVHLYRHLSEKKKEFVLSKQLLRSGTAVGAMTREAQNGESKADFIHKLSIAQKECDETIDWLILLNETSYLSETEFKSIHADALELLKIIRSIILTTKTKFKPVHSIDS
jgi:four helix bundle protein